MLSGQSSPGNKDKQLVTVKTGEPYQPARIYYQVFKKKTVLSALKKLRCMEYEPERDRWNWLYEAEAKKLRFTRPFSALTAADRPLILGYFTFRGEDEMLLDVRSTERAIQGLDFFDKRINRYAAKPTHLRLVNRLFTPEEMPNREIHPSLDPFFDRDDIPCSAKEMEKALTEIEEKYADDPEAKDEAFSAYMEEEMQRAHPEIEELIIHPDKQDRIGLSMALQMRQMEAFEHWRGNLDFRASHVLQQWAASLMDDEEFYEEEGEEEEESTVEESTVEESATAETVDVKSADSEEAS